MAVDVSGIAYFAPILSFLLVFFIVFAVLKGTKILGEHLFVQLFISFIIATLFITIAGVRQYVETIAPWFAVLIIALFFLLFLTGFAKADFMNKGIGIAVVVVLVIIFLISGIVVFGNTIAPYLPGSDFPGGNPETLRLLDWLYSGRVLGAVLLLIVAGIVSWILAKGK